MKSSFIFYLFVIVDVVVLFYNLGQTYTWLTCMKINTPYILEQRGTTLPIFQAWTKYWSSVEWLTIFVERQTLVHFIRQCSSTHGQEKPLPKILVGQTWAMSKHTLHMQNARIIKL
jgi:hypothetical protein